MDQESAGLTLAIFFCQQIDQNQDVNRRAIERLFGGRIRFFALPCSGRIDSVQLMQALETGADKVYLITCPEEACRYREGNKRAKKRLTYTQALIEELGLERERLELIVPSTGTIVTIDELARGLLAREASLGPSPIKSR